MKKAFPKTTEVVIKFNTKMLLADFANACKMFNTTSTVTPANFAAFVKELTRDIELVICNDDEWFENGLNNDCYEDFNEPEEDEDED